MIVESRMGEHTTVQSGGSTEWQDKGWENKFIWKPIGLQAKYAHISRSGWVGGCDSSMDGFTTSPTSHYGARVVLWGEDGGSLVTATLSTLGLVDLTPRYARMGSNDSEHMWIFRYVKKILEYFIEKLPINFIFWDLKSEITEVILKFQKGFHRCFS